MAEQKVAEGASPSTSPSETARPPPGTSFESSNPESDYTMLDKIGTGSFGTVWKALHRPSNSVVAVKKVCTPANALAPIRLLPQLCLRALLHGNRFPPTTTWTTS